MLMNQVIAHRGAFSPEGSIPRVQNQYEVPENTLMAFEKAFQNGWGIETDVRLTADGNLVLIHDNDVVRFSRNVGLIDEMAIAEIRRILYKNSPQFNVPTLDEFCQLAKKYASNGKPLFIAFQVKRSREAQSGVRVGSEVAKKIQQYKFDNSILFDTTFEEAKVLHNKFPWLNLSVSVGEENYSPTIYTLDQVLTDKFTSIYSSVWADEWKKPGSIYNRKLFEKLRKAYSGRIDVVSPELHFNENHPLSRDLSKIIQFWKEVIGWNIDGICTDYPSKLQGLL